MTAAEVVEQADALRESALAAETRAKHARTDAERERARGEAERLWTRERDVRALAPRALLRAIGRAS